MHSTNRSRGQAIDMLSGPLLLKVILFALPLMLSGILQLVFNAADTIVVGRFAGSTALAAVGSVGALNHLIIGLFIGLSVGVDVLVARYTGAGDPKSVSSTVHTAVVLALAGGAVLSVIGIMLARPLLTLMGSPEDVIDLAVLYTRIIFVGIPVQMLYNFCAAVLRAVGDTKRPLFYLSVAGVINVVLNVFFVVSLHMSVAGVALATILSQGVSAALIVRFLLAADGAIRIVPAKLRIHRDKLREIIRIGLPAGIQSSVFSLSNVVIQSSVNSFGSIVIAGNAAAMNIGNFVYQAMNTFQQAVTCFAGQNMGAHKPSRIIRALWANLFWVSIVGLVLGPAACLFGTQLLSLFTTDPAVIASGLERLNIVCAPYFLCGIMDVMTGTLRGIGYSVLPMIISMMGACLFRIVWIVTVFRASPSLRVLMLSYPASWLITFLVLVVVFICIWKKVRATFTPEELRRA